MKRRDISLLTACTKVVQLLKSFSSVNWVDLNTVSYMVAG